MENYSIKIKDLHKNPTKSKLKVKQMFADIQTLSHNVKLPQ